MKYWRMERSRMQSLTGELSSQRVLVAMMVPYESMEGSEKWKIIAKFYV